jgi:hypothetical protein
VIECDSLEEIAAVPLTQAERDYLLTLEQKAS